MNEIIVKPLERVGSVYFGMNREEVRNILGDYKEFKKSKFSKNTADDFETCHVFYDLDNNCEAIELFSNINIKIDEDTILPTKFNEIFKLLEKIDEKLEIEEDRCTSIKYSIGVYAPNKKVESVLFGKEGYYKF